MGLVTDLALIALGSTSTGKPRVIPGWSAELATRYDDHVRARLDTDTRIERASDAIRGYSAKDRIRGLAFLVRQIQERTGLTGVQIEPGVIRELLSTPADRLLAEGYESLTRDGPLPIHSAQTEEAIQVFRRVTETLANEDVIAIEQRSALADLGQYIAHRQVLQLTARIESMLPSRPFRLVTGRKDIQTRVLDEDFYPVGGYTSIATRGSVESMLHSQLAYVESERPDLFDAKFVRDELFYYSRDENHFPRRRRVYVFALFPDLRTARYKDENLPAQRIVITLSLILAAIHRLSAWLEADALNFKIVFVSDGETELRHEKQLLEVLLWEAVRRGEAGIQVLTEQAYEADCASLSRSSETQVLSISTVPLITAPANPMTSHLCVGQWPELVDARGQRHQIPTEEPFDSWGEIASRLLESWV